MGHRNYLEIPFTDFDYCFVNSKSVSPVEDPNGHVAVYACPPGHTASADLMHCSHRPLEMLIVAPATAGLSVNLASPDWPVVEVGLPWHLVMAPEIPPQMASRATFLLCSSMALGEIISKFPPWRTYRLLPNPGKGEVGLTRWRQCKRRS